MQLTREEITKKLKDILVSADGRNADFISSCAEDADLTSDFGLTSVSMLYMVIAIEEEFQITFDNVGVNSFATLSDVIDYIERKLS